jgi:chromosome segregation ATPase
MLRQSLMAALSITVCVGVATAQNPKKPNNQQQDEKRENQAVKEAQENVNDAQKSLREREKDVRDKLAQVRSAIQARQNASNDLKKVEDRLEAQHAETTGLVAAREKLKSAQKDFDQKSSPVLDRLKTEPGYRAAQDALTKAKAAIRPDPDNPDADRKAAAAAHAKAIEQVRDLERTAIDKVDELRSLRAKVDDAEAGVQAAKKKFDRAVEKDPEMKSAKQAFDKAKLEEDKAEDAVAGAQRRVADARSKVAQAVQRFQQKKAQDLKDANKPKNKKKK